LVRNGILRLASGSPAIDAVGGTYSDITADVDGQSRSGAKAIGADEYSTAAVLRRPLTTADVGPGVP
jgi:poly(beta-D-mannuronate) lyase